VSTTPTRIQHTSEVIDTPPPDIPHHSRQGARQGSYATMHTRRGASRAHRLRAIQAAARGGEAQLLPPGARTRGWLKAGDQRRALGPRGGDATR